MLDVRIDELIFFLYDTLSLVCLKCCAVLPEAKSCTNGGGRHTKEALWGRQRNFAYSRSKKQVNTS